MDRIKARTPDITQENIERLVELFPEVATEVEAADGTLEHAIDFDALRELLGYVAEGNRERYQFTWPGKREAKAEAYRQITKTMRPCKDESVDWESTQNLYIEGDNLDALKILRETYAGKVKLIYIDPPYNTGHDFVYDDDFAQTHGEYDAESGQFDEGGGRLVANLESNGRFHSDWCSMMYPRLLLARDLLSADGVIFISIDDNEQENLKKICDEIFGAVNFVAQLVWERAFSPKNDAKYVSNSHDYVVLYAKSITDFKIGRLERTAEANSRYSNPDNDPRGPWMSSDISVKTYNEACDYPITTPSGRVVEPPAGRCWRLSKNAFFERLNDNRIWFGPKGDGVPRMKRFLSELKFDGMAPTSIMYFKDVGHSQEGAQEVSKLMDGGFFDGPKPQRLMKRVIRLANVGTKDIVLDFFSGSGSMAQSVMQQNVEDGGSRKFIMVQLPEETDVKSEAYKAGYATIAEIGKERIRRAGAKIAQEVADANTQLELGQEPKPVPDIGFRVLKIDSSNFEDTHLTPEATIQDVLFDMVDNVKPGRSALDLLFQVLPAFRIPYSAHIETLSINGKTVFNVDEGLLLACFDEDVDTATIEEIARMKPSYAVMRDLSFARDQDQQNFEELFRTFSPDTIRRVI